MNFLKIIAIGFGILLCILLIPWFLLIAGVSVGLNPRLLWFIPVVYFAIATYRSRRRKGKWFYGCGIGAIVFTLAALGY